MKHAAIAFAIMGALYVAGLFWASAKAEAMGFAFRDAGFDDWGGMLK